jgi:hypothetical protein
MGKRFTPEEDALIMDSMNEKLDHVSIDDLCKDLGELLDRTPNSIYNRLYRMSKKEPAAVIEESKPHDLDNPIARIMDLYNQKLDEIERLKKRILQLETEQKQFAEVLMMARKMLVNDEQAATSFKMDQNGNLERMK